MESGHSEGESIGLTLAFGDLSLSVSRKRSTREQREAGESSEPPPAASVAAGERPGEAEPQVSTGADRSDVRARGRAALASSSASLPLAAPARSHVTGFPEDPEHPVPSWGDRITAARRAGQAAAARIHGDRSRSTWARHPAAERCGANKIYVVLVAKDDRVPCCVLSLAEQHVLVGRPPQAGAIYHAWETYREAKTYWEEAGFVDLPICRV